MRKQFFVMHFKKTEIKDGHEYEIQVLNSRGEATSWRTIGKHDTSLIIDKYFVPEAVIMAAKEQDYGEGVYVDEAGQAVQPF